MKRILFCTLFLAGFATMASAQKKQQLNETVSDIQSENNTQSEVNPKVGEIIQAPVYDESGKLIRYEAKEVGENGTLKDVPREKLLRAKKQKATNVQRD